MGNDANGYLLPSWYVAETPSNSDLNVASMIWGFSLALAVFTFNKGMKQSWTAYKRGKLWNAYIIMIWAEWWVCVIISIVSWLYLSPSLSILPGFWIFFWLLVLWVIQIQCILQIMINRVRLLVVDQRKADYLKWGVAIFVGLINISVFVIWIPARLQISQRWIDINNWWDRVEKTLFGLCDICLNLYFIYLVRSKLIANGLKKYKKLVRFNVLMVLISMSLDIILIGVMSLPNTAVYIQFHPLVYLVKLHIEMNVADLIAKIVKASNELNVYRNTLPSAPITSSNGNSNSSRRAAQNKRRSDLQQRDSFQLVLGRDFAGSQGSKDSAVECGFERSIDLESGILQRDLPSDKDIVDEGIAVGKTSTSDLNGDSSNGQTLESESMAKLKTTCSRPESSGS